jgi:hypothetical protein
VEVRLAPALVATVWIVLPGNACAATFVNTAASATLAATSPLFTRESLRSALSRARTEWGSCGLVCIYRISLRRPAKHSLTDP